MPNLLEVRQNQGRVGKLVWERRGTARRINGTLQRKP